MASKTVAGDASGAGTRRLRCTQTACPAIDFVNLSPVELDLTALPAGTSVSACFEVNDRRDPVP